MGDAASRSFTRTAASPLTLDTGHEGGVLLSSVDSLEAWDPGEVMLVIVHDKSFTSAVIMGQRVVGRQVAVMESLSDRGSDNSAHRQAPASDLGGADDVERQVGLLRNYTNKVEFYSCPRQN